MSKLLTVQTYKHIADGWAHYLFPNKETESLAHARARICSECPLAKMGTYEKLLKDDIVEVQGMKCTVCGCPLSAKLRSTNETCPNENW